MGILTLLATSHIAVGQRDVADEAALGLEFKTMVFAAQSQRSARAAEDDGPLIPELPDLYYYDGSNHILVEFLVNQMSSNYVYSGDEAFDFFTQEVNAEGELEYRRAFRVNVNGSWRSALVVMLPTTDAERPFKLFAVDTSPENLATGTIKVFNLSNEPVVLNADGEIYPLYSMGAVELDISGIEKNRLPVALALKEDEGFKLVYRRVWSMRSSVRGIYFIYTLNDDLRHWYMRNIIL
ncbi:hypothetical protein SH580_17230 [Coraliomargarita algicola]|uniref:DUF4397 domain-containing protein n=1 Tax=Coraliomargarita algicola TaxID=3092156 RepID=A0ABZ0RJS1_9BACT|nr:hypothetical protein [Coraliomargarita sp. J2-16]WPJ95167.1 hypothetical protein SH580_17230 [Coraliomargarita sp. J2-16]